MNGEVVAAVGRRDGEAPEPVPASGLLGRLEGIAAGDRACAAWLYDRFAPTLHRRLRARYPELETDDLVHDAFVFFFQRRAKVLRDFVARWSERAPSCRAEDLARHLWDLACGVASNRRRSVWARRVVPLPPAFAVRSAAARGLRGVIARDSLERLERCLGRGAARTFLYFQLRYRDGLRPAEIVTATGWTAKVVYKLGERFHRALARCVERLGLRSSA